METPASKSARGMTAVFTLGPEDAVDLVRALETAINQERFLAEKHPSSLGDHAMGRALAYERLLRLVKEGTVTMEEIRKERDHGEEPSYEAGAEKT